MPLRPETCTAIPMIPYDKSRSGHVQDLYDCVDHVQDRKCRDYVRDRVDHVRDRVDHVRDGKHRDHVRDRNNRDHVRDRVDHVQSKWPFTPRASSTRASSTSASSDRSSSKTASALDRASSSKTASARQVPRFMFQPARCCDRFP